MLYEAKAESVFAGLALEVVLRVLLRRNRIPKAAAIEIAHALQKILDVRLDDAPLDPAHPAYFMRERLRLFLARLEIELPPGRRAN